MASDKDTISIEPWIQYNSELIKDKNPELESVFFYCNHCNTIEERYVKSINGFAHCSTCMKAGKITRFANTMDTPIRAFLWNKVLLGVCSNPSCRRIKKIPYLQRKKTLLCYYCKKKNDAVEMFQTLVKLYFNSYDIFLAELSSHKGLLQTFKQDANNYVKFMRELRKKVTGK